MSSSSLPEVFFSGAVHGNERIGPTTTIELIRLFTTNVKNLTSDTIDTAPPFHHILTNWLERLRTTRLITIMPTANALGYYQNVREENGIDPNRDFPWGVASNDCMQTTAARALNSLWRERMFQLSITFHGGMRAIAYEWGSPNYKDASPDDGALVLLGQYAQKAAGVGDGKNQGFYYPEGDLNSLVYPVEGGMEDWAYAASFDSTGYSVPCEPTSYGGNYPKELTSYTKDQLRTFNFLVETADAKIPEESTLGSLLPNNVLAPTQLLPLSLIATSSSIINGNEDVNEVNDEVNDDDDDVNVLLNNTKRGLTMLDLLWWTGKNDNELGGGHILRNLRLALFMVDLVEPYVEWYYNPTTIPGGNENENHYSWDVGGALHVDDTALFVLQIEVKSDVDVLQSDVLKKNCPSHDKNKVRDFMSQATRIDIGGTNSGRTIWTERLSESPSSSEKDELVHFVGEYSSVYSPPPYSPPPNSPPSYSVPQSPPSDQVMIMYVIVAGAKVDQQWKTPQREYEPKGMGPQSHLVRARTEEGYTATNGNRKIQGHLWWYSTPKCRFTNNNGFDIMESRSSQSNNNKKSSALLRGGVL